MPLINRHRALALCAMFALSTACSDDPAPDNRPQVDQPADQPDSGPDNGPDSTPDTPTDTPPDGDMDPPVDPPRPVGEVITCPTALPAAPAGQLCDATPGDADTIVLQGTVLAADGKIYKNGGIVIDRRGSGDTLSPNGTISYVGCDAPAMAGSATVITCADGVISPGLINAHDHITYNPRGTPKDHGEDRFDHRHDWRVGARGNQRVPSDGNTTKTEAVLFAELRHVLAGTTSIAGSGGAVGFTRNLDRANANGGLPNLSVRYETFPLGDTSGTLRASGCNYPGIDNETVLNNTIYLPHIAEGIDREARNEFTCLNGGAGVDLIRENTSIIHGIGLSAGDIAQMAQKRAKLVWSPRTNIDLYGQTADVLTYTRLGVTVGLGTDWIISGSMNMLRELRCVDHLNKNHYDNFFTDRDLFEIATINSAITLGAEASLGSIAVGKIADVAIFDGSARADYRAVLDAEVKDVALVMRGGHALHGDTPLVQALVADAATGCEAIDICGNSRTLCAVKDTTHNLAALRAESSTYDLFYCDTPPNEPTCMPSRPGEYMGITGEDRDGDGLPDNMDSCPVIFNPRRPASENQQPNEDADPFGDACDVCPLNEGAVCEAFDPNDTDGDGVPNGEDNCPNVANPDQADADNDGIGDVCDACPDVPNPGGTACPATIYAIKRDMVPMGDRVRLNDVIVSGAGTDGFFVQVPADSDDFMGVDFSGLFVFSRTLDPKPSPGDRLSLEGTIGSFQDQVQLIDPVNIMVNAQGAPPEPLLIDKADAVHTAPRGPALEGVLVRIEDLTVTSVDEFAQFNTFTVDNGMIVDDILYTFPTPQVGDTFRAITAPISFRFNVNHLAPRSADDFDLGPPRLSAITPAQGFVEAGTTATLAVTLSGDAEAAQTVALAYSSAAISGPATVTIPQGARSANVTITGVTAGATLQTITATLDGETATASVLVYNQATPRAVQSLTPSAINARPNTAVTVTVVLDVPAAAGGATVNLSVTNAALTIPATVTVPAGQVSVDFMATTAAADVTGVLSAQSGASPAVTANVSVNSRPAECFIISEYVEGTSNNKALEVYNCGSNPLELSEFGLCISTKGSSGANNTTCTSAQFMFPMGTLAVDETFVVCNSGLTDKTSCDVAMGVGNAVAFNGDDRLGLFKDGDGDGRFDAANDTLMDAFGVFTDNPASMIWMDKTYDRCNLTPFLGTSAFEVLDYFAELPVNTYTGLGIAPMQRPCPGAP